MEFTLQPNIYTTSIKHGTPNLLSLLEKVWVTDLKEHETLGKGSMYILSGFSNFNGGVRFYNHIENHIQKGGQCQVLLGGSTRQNMSSVQIVRKLLDIGCDVGIINRKAIFHAKCYGHQFNNQSSLIVSSGNFTSRGLTQNIEASLYLNHEDMQRINFDWEVMFHQLRQQDLDYYQATQKADAPFWKLLFNEERSRIEDDSDPYNTLVVTLSHSDTVRIQAEPGSKQYKGTQYFWLSKDSYDFFPSLDIPNQRGYKKTYQTLINVNYIDLNLQHQERVTFEAENNFDFRLGTSLLKGSKIAGQYDLAALTRVNERDYEMRIFAKDSPQYRRLIPYAIHHIGHQGKQYGYIDNKSFFATLK